jgi:glycosyltransferase involved in cell wall biosynthesis/2-polyprenyl-3-methyl-5-hydroxy-6-metoxy-1,4-benzoquinol methylase
MSNRTGSTPVASSYDKEYFEKHCGPIPYTWNDSRWMEFFAQVADGLVRSLHPGIVLDVGCAVGFLVQALWNRGVRAYGIDISEYAISEVPTDVRSYCRLLSATEPLPDDFPQQYDLITCIEVLEHLTDVEGRVAIENMASRTSTIVFSSTPNDFTEPTHVNVRPVIYWLRLFLEFGFYPDLTFDASVVSPQAFLLRKSRPNIEEEALDWFAESINRRVQLHEKQRQIVLLTDDNKALQRRLDGEIKKRDDELQSTRGQLGQLRDVVSATIAEVAERDGTIAAIEAARREERDRYRDVLADKQAAIFERNKNIQELQTAQSGLFWELLSAYRRAKNHYLPPDSRRRRLYDWSLETIKGFKRGGNAFVKVLFLPARHPIRTLRNLNSINAEKLLYHLRQGNYALLKTKVEKNIFGEPAIVHPAVENRVPSQKFCLILSGCPGDAYRYRCEHQAEQLRLLGLTVDSTYFDQVDYPSALENYQTFWLHRVPHTDAVDNFIRAARQAGKPVIFDTDDLVFDEEKVPYIRALERMPGEEVDLYYDGVRRYHRTLSRCRFATVTTEPLRRAVQRMFPHMRCRVIPNVLSEIQVAHAQEALAEPRPAEDEGIVRIAYLSGTHTHNIDFRECSSALVRVLESFPQVRLTLVGHLDVGEEFARFEDRVERHALMPWQDLPRVLRRVDINLAPLEPENPFTECKSSLKYFEAALLGVPTIASDLEPYRKPIVHGENGYLCRSEQDWYQCMSRLVQDTVLRTKIGLMARADVLNNCTTRTNAPCVTEVLKEIVSSSALRWREALRVNFILRAPIAQVGGGYKVLFLLAHYLANRGHDVHVYVEAIAHLEGKSDSEIFAFCRRYFGDSPAQVHVGHGSIGASDVTIATNWPTAFVVAELPNALCKLYLIQDFEPEFYEPESALYAEVEKTYELALKKVTIGRYLADLFADKDRMPISYFSFGIDHAVFHARGRSPSPRLRVLFFARPSLKRRGFSIGVQALAKVHENCPEIELLLYGMEEKAKLPFPYENLGPLDQWQLAEAMRQADIHVSFSLSNISQVPFQAMACGCAVVEAKVPSVDAMVEDGRNCLLAKPEPEAVADAVLRLIRDEDLRRRITTAGLEFVQDLSWENSCRVFENILLDSLMLDASKQRQQESSLSGYAPAAVGTGDIARAELDIHGRR